MEPRIPHPTFAPEQGFVHLRRFEMCLTAGGVLAEAPNEEHDDL